MVFLSYGQDDGLNWAIAGRNPKKLQALLDKMKSEVTYRIFMAYFVIAHFPN